jgi:hypothetical protein
MNKQTEQLQIKLHKREDAIIRSLGSKGRAIISNFKTKSEYVCSSEQSKIIYVINELDETCKIYGIKI